MKLHSSHGFKQITQVDSEIEYTEDAEFAGYGLVQVDKDVTTGTLIVQLVAESGTRTFDITKVDINSLNLLVKKVLSTGTIAKASVRIFK